LGKERNSFKLKIVSSFESLIRRRKYPASWEPVAMDDAFRMSSIESIGDLNSRVEKQIQLERAAGDAFAKRLTF